MMWSRYMLLLLFGLSAGFVTACGYFALFSFVGVLNRFIQYSNTANHIHFYENIIIVGVTFGNAVCIFMPYEFFSLVFWVIFALCSGIFAGCFILSLAEAVKGVPVFARRTRLRIGLAALILALALGKCGGSLFYFFKIIASNR